MADESELAALDQLSTEELRERAFTLARQRHDVRFFWSLFQHLPTADDAEALDGSPSAIGGTIDDALELWRQFSGHGLTETEPLLRAAFVDYLTKHSAE
jgi:hypothetical protein